MAYDLRGNGALRGGNRLNTLRGSQDEVNPMASVANIVDAMLVFSLGLMIAIVVSWNVDLNTIQEVVQEDEVTEVNDIEDMAENMQSDGSSYSELGTVYQDPNTGKMYMLTKDADKSASAKGNTASRD